MSVIKYRIMYPMKIAVHIFCALCFLGVAFAQVDVTIPNLGAVQGLEVEFNGQVMREFLGVPYAEPPVGQRRFARPEPKLPWTDVREVKTFGAACPQPALPTGSDPGEAISEDCLFLNIIVPPGASANAQVPVMIFIPGRGFRLYSGSEYVGEEISATGSVIVVTINYRFLTFGFFSTDEDCMPGNYGLWDQRKAIEWVRDNIGAFGGDSNRITLVGQGREGATGVSSQILSPLNTNELFQRAIIQSSQFTDISYIMTKEQAVTLSKSLTELLRCNQTVWEVQLECLRNKSWEEIVEASEPSVLGGYFEPRIDGYFFPESLDRLLAREHIYDYDVMAGVTSDEGIILMNGYIDIDQVFQDVEDVLNFIGVEFQGRYGPENAQLALDAMIEKYVDPLNGLTDRDSALRFMFDMFGDGYYVSNTINFLRRHQEGNANTYLYFFDFVDDTYRLLTEEPRVPTRATQGEDLFYLWDTIFGMETALNAPDASPAKITRNQMILYWTNFIQSGNPNTGTAPAVSWQTFDDQTENYLLIGDTITSAQILKPGYTDFFINYIPRLTMQTETCSLEAPAPNILTGVGDDISEQFVNVAIVDSDGVELGEVRGVQLTADEGVGGRSISSFLGIPYTLPPTQERRFRRSEVLTDWGQDTFRNATEPPPECPQISFPMFRAASQSEDCLYLNIYAPAVSADEVLPVIVYIHSGRFQTGTGVAFDGSTLASYANALVVTVDYRLAALGFLSTGDSASPGNYGILDVVTALKWIKKYIGSFGGDPGNVMAFGQGNGAQIAHLISLNGLNDDLIHKIIALGESVISILLLQSATRDPLQFAIQVATALDCPTGNTEDLVSCLRTKDAQDILQVPIDNPQGALLDPFYPVWDGTDLKDSPDKILASGDFESIPIIIGATEADNTLTPTFLLDPPVACPDKQAASDMIDLTVDILYGGRKEFGDLFRMFYLESELSPVVPVPECPIGQQMGEFFSDIWLNAGHLETGKLLARANKEMYLYYLTFHPDDHPFGDVAPSWVKTAFGDDFPYAFGWPYDERVTDASGVCYNRADRKVAIDFMSMISTLANTGTPSVADAAWEPYDPARYNALFLDACPTQQSVQRGAEKDAFWYTVLPALQQALINETETPTTTAAPTDSRDVESFIGLELTSEEAGRLIGILIIVLVVVVGLVCLALLVVCLRRACSSPSPNKPV